MRGGGPGSISVSRTKIPAGPPRLVVGCFGLIVCVFEDLGYVYFYPYTILRPVFMLPVFSRTLLDLIRSQVADVFGDVRVYLVYRRFLGGVFGCRFVREEPSDILFINGRVLGDSGFRDVLRLVSGEGVVVCSDGEVVTVLVPYVFLDVFRDFCYDVVGDEFYSNVFSLFRKVCGGVVRVFGDVFDFVDFVFDVLGDYRFLECFVGGGFRVFDGCFRVLDFDGGRLIVDARDSPVVLGSGLKVSGDVVLRGPVFVGEGVCFRGFCEVLNSVVGSFCDVGGVICNSIVFDGCSIGCGCYVNNAVLGFGCEVGDCCFIDGVDSYALVGDCCLILHGSRLCGVPYVGCLSIVYGCFEDVCIPSFYNVVERCRIGVGDLVKSVRLRLGLNIDCDVMRSIVNDTMLRERVFVSRFDVGSLG